ncbi:hypothetical protein NMG60_11003122 [Bertholletia excelsa]
MAMQAKDPNSQPQIELVVDPVSVSASNHQQSGILVLTKGVVWSVLARFHAGYFRISLSLCSQALLWKTLGEPTADPHEFRRVLGHFPLAAFISLWSLALFTLAILSLLYLLRCVLHFQMVKNEFFNNVCVNYLFAPWISWLLLLQSSPFFTPETKYYLVLWWVFVIPIVALDVKIYGQWFTKGKRFLSSVANPTSQLSVIGNLAGAWAAARMEYKESALCMFSIGMAHYLVLFITLYQRLPGNDHLPVMLRPVFFLFFAAPSLGSLAWDSITGTFDNSSKMLFFLALFLFMSLVSRPTLFKKSMKKFNVVWWAYSFPLTVLAIASTKYAEEVKSGAAHLIMVVLSALSVLVSLALMVFTALNTSMLFPSDDPVLSPSSSCSAV